MWYNIRGEDNMALALALACGKEMYLYEVNSNFKHEELDLCMDVVCNIYRGLNVYIENKDIDSFMESLIEFDVINSYNRLASCHIDTDFHYVNTVYVDDNILEAYTDFCLEKTEFRYGARNFYIVDGEEESEYSPINYVRDGRVLGAHYFKLKDGVTNSPHDIFTFYRDRAYSDEQIINAFKKIFGV